MDLHRQVGAFFGIFTMIMLVWNLLTPDNHDHWLNVTEHSILSMLFLFSTSVKPSFGTILQIGALFLGAFMTATTGDIQPAGVVGMTAAILTYIYSRFQSFGLVTVSLVAGLQFSVAITGAVAAGYDPLVSFGHAIVWTAISLVGVWISWVALQQFSARILKTTKEVHEINKTLMSERKADGTKKT